MQSRYTAVPHNLNCSASSLDDTELITGSPDIDVEFDAEDIVEEAEQLLREAAPHDYDVLIIGGGPAGYSCAMRAAELGASVGLVESDHIGGRWVNQSGIPFQSLLASAKISRLLRRAEEFGIGVSSPQIDYEAITARAVACAESQRLQIENALFRHGVEIIRGTARFLESHTIEVSRDGATHIVRAIHIVLATGSHSQTPKFPGRELPGSVTPDNFAKYGKLPSHLLVAGGGVCGLEYTCLYAALGAKVTVLEPGGQILPEYDEDIQLQLACLLEKDGIEVVTRVKFLRLEPTGEALKLVYLRDNKEHTLPADCFLWTVGRKGNVRYMNLEATSIVAGEGRIEVDEFGETDEAGIYAVGGCAAPNAPVHQAMAEGRALAERIRGKSVASDASPYSYACHTIPQVATVGLTQKQARQENRRISTATAHFRSGASSGARGEGEGFVKIVIETETERILGCQILGARAVDMIHEVLLAIKGGLTAEQLATTAHAQSSGNEAIALAALAAHQGRPSH